MDLLQLNQIELEVLNSGVWGTIAPHSVAAAKALAEVTGAAHGLLCHSETAAYEAVLRYLGASLSELPHGDVVLVGEKSVPTDSLNALCVGATPLFCPVCERCGMISPKSLGECLEHAPLPLRAVVLDYHADRAGEYPLDAVSAVCREHHVPLILMAGGHIGAYHDGKPLTSYADAVIYTLGEGSAVDAGGGGLVMTDDQALWMGAFAYHNCGRTPGAGCSLVMDAIVGGDMRATEWIAVVAEEILRQKAMATPTPRTPVAMKDQPIFAK